MHLSRRKRIGFEMGMLSCDRQERKSHIGVSLF
jgi:hypothetical protein